MLAAGGETMVFGEGEALGVERAEDDTSTFGSEVNRGVLGGAHGGCRGVGCCAV
jgi:hypothetical protein